MNMSHNVRYSIDLLPLQAQNVHKSPGIQSTTYNNTYGGTNLGTYCCTFSCSALMCRIITLFSILNSVVKI
jgi:hypothetical protein